jgi:hypothetical protein
MAFLDGPGQVKTVNIGGTSVAGTLVENLTTSTEPDSYASASGINIERGSMKTMVACNVLDYSAVAGLVVLQDARTLSDVQLTYTDDDIKKIEACIIRVKPLVGLVTDSCRVWGALAAETNDDLETDFTDLGPTLGSPEFTFDFPFEGTDGCGRPYYDGTVRVAAEFVLPGDATVANPYTAITGASMRGVSTNVAFALPGGNYLVLSDVHMFIHYANDDSNSPRAVRVKVEGVGSGWAAMLGYTNGAATAVDTAWGTVGAVDPGDYFTGCEVEATGFTYDETLTVWDS